MGNEEFEDIFGNVPFENIKKIQKYIKDNYVSLNLYNKEKEKNKKLEARKYMLNAETGEVTAIPIDNNYISKDKIKDKIKELEKDVKDFEEYWSKDPRRFKRQQCIDYYKLEALQDLLKESESNDI